MLELAVLVAVICLQLVVQLRKDGTGNITERQPPHVLPALNLVPALGRLIRCRRAVGEFGPATHVSGHHVGPLEPAPGFKDAEVYVENIL